MSPPVKDFPERFEFDKTGLAPTLPHCTDTASPAGVALLQACVEQLGTALSPTHGRSLRTHAQAGAGHAAPLTRDLLALPETQWGEVILAHRAHGHRWYDALAERVSIRAFATFLMENWAFPPFLPMLERTYGVQICAAGKAAIRRNLEDEQVPIAHAALMRRMIVAVQAQAGMDSLPPLSGRLVDRLFAFYYGYYCDPWHLVGSLYATETMALHRVTHMGAGLQRLGIDPDDLEFIRIHSVCDEDHAREWCDDVIIPSVRACPALRGSIAAGLATCLETSANYLDDVNNRLADHLIR